MVLELELEQRLQNLFLGSGSDFFLGQKLLCLLVCWEAASQHP